MISKKKAVYLVLIVLIVTAVVTALLTSYFTRQKIESGEIYLKGEEYETLMKYFEQENIKQIIEANYIREVDPDELVSGSMRGMVDALDDGYSAFYTEEEYENFDEGNDGSFIAQGMQLSRDEATDYARVDKIFADTPAYDASLQEGDLILTVDGVDTRHEDLPSTLARLRGVDGTEASLMVSAGEETRECRIVRKSAAVQVVFSSMVNDEIAYIRIDEFSGQSADGFMAALDDIKGENAKGMIIDLRSTPGGNITQAVKIADMFLSDGIICSSKGRESDGAKWEAQKDLEWQSPVVILVNAKTAGVAEVFAAALQDRGIASVLGEATQGRVAVTSYYKLSSSGNVVKLATADYYTASGTKVTDVGVHPDEVIADTETKGEQADDAMLLRAAKLLTEKIG